MKNTPFIVLLEQELAQTTNEEMGLLPKETQAIYHQWMSIGEYDNFHLESFRHSTYNYFTDLLLENARSVPGYWSNFPG